jgi:membrane fusion protein, adhesin transport system
MLNISENSIQQRMQKHDFNSFAKTELSGSNRMFVRWLYGVFVVIIVMLFLPWTQNIQSDGVVTTLNPSNRPQTIQSTIAGRIEHWFVQEGQFVPAGDTIVFLSEIKAEYFDPNLIQRTANQVLAKESAIDSYRGKVTALEAQIKGLQQEATLKEEQLRNKILQSRAKIMSDSIALELARIDVQTANRQLEGAQELFNKDIESLTKLENMRLKAQEARTKLVAAENKLQISRNELANVRLQLTSVPVEYNQKINKASSDKFSTLSMLYDSEAEVNKLQIQQSNYEKRSSFYYITAPQDCYITKAITPGLGETVKEGEGIVTIMPAEVNLAVELFIRPMDLPLVEMGQEVRFIFDGWPAFVFSGWPGMSFGTYKGRVAAIDQQITDAKNRYRILVRPTGDKGWPEALRVGGGAQGIALLNNVPMWYEVWRRLNGFPPDYYERGTIREPKLKAPAKSIK